MAEEIGLIVPLGDWVLQAGLPRRGAVAGRLTVAVNLSAVQFRNPTLALVGRLGAGRVRTWPPTRLELEITETVLLQDDARCSTTLHQIRELGVRISMDDFGTGYSSLSYLRSFPFDKIKIDRSFIHELGEGTNSRYKPVPRPQQSVSVATMEPTAQLPTRENHCR